MLLGVSGCPASHPPAGERSAVPPLAPPAAEAPPSPFPPASAEKTPFGAHLGMDLEAFRTILPQVSIPSPDGQGAVRADVHGLDGSFTYTFEGGKLKWVLFDKYIDELTLPNFDRCLAATDAIIADYTRQYGPPLSLKTGTRTFKDPRVEHHWGYEVMEAVWKAAGMKFQVDFDFMGGKGEYHLLVKVEFQRGDYPYF